ncbi:MAG: hypothetical protein PHQ59_00140 [Candidatus Daviesbacteria bacterium]|nr:hypothetical protein [Candidatus Daviesbacteria bacterium]
MPERCNLCNIDGLIRCQEPLIPLIQGRFEIRGEGKENYSFKDEKIESCVMRINLLAIQKEFAIKQMKAAGNLFWQGRCYGCAKEDYICQNPQSSEIEGVWRINLITDERTLDIDRKSMDEESVQKCPNFTKALEFPVLVGS